MSFRYAVLKPDGITVAYTIVTTDEANMAGQPIPTGHTVEQVPDSIAVFTPDSHQFDPATGEFVDRVVPLLEVQTKKLAELSISCGDAIVNGFSSSALGSAYDYPSQLTDQTNMQRVAISGGALWCAVAGSWTLEAHTDTQGIQVLADFGTHCDTQRDHLATLTATIMAETDPAVIEAITW